MRPVEFTPEQIIEAGQTLRDASRNVTGFALRQRIGGGNPNRTVGMSTVCYFTAGPRIGQSQDYSATWAPLAVGTPCLDGMGSTGFVR